MRQRLTGTLKDAGIRRQVRGVQVRKEASSGRKNPGSEDTEKGQEKWNSLWLDLNLCEGKYLKDREGSGMRGAKTSKETCWVSTVGSCGWLSIEKGCDFKVRMASGARAGAAGSEAPAHQSRAAGKVALGLNPPDQTLRSIHVAEATRLAEPLFSRLVRGSRAAAFFIKSLSMILTKPSTWEASFSAVLRAGLTETIPSSYSACGAGKALTRSPSHRCERGRSRWGRSHELNPSFKIDTKINYHYEMGSRNI